MTPARILGAHFRPPAKLIFLHLTTGQELTLIHEPDNPYDPNAIKVLLPEGALPSDSEFIDNLQSFGHDIESLRDSGPIHLGYIERGRTQDFIGVFLIILSFDPKGQPLAVPKA